MPTLATILKARGFATGAFVGAFPLDARFGLTPGFDVYDGRFDDAHRRGRFHVAERPASAVVALATSMDRRAGTAARWLAWVHVYEPHAPYRPPPPFDREYCGSHRTSAKSRRSIAALGPLLASVRRSARPTLVVSDRRSRRSARRSRRVHARAVRLRVHAAVPLIIAEVGLKGRPQARTAASDDGHAIGRSASEVVRRPRAARRHPADHPRRAADCAAGRRCRGIRSATRADRATPAVASPSYFEAMSPMLDSDGRRITGVLAGARNSSTLPLRRDVRSRRRSDERTNLSGRAGGASTAARDASRRIPAALPGAAAPEDPRRRRAASRARLRVGRRPPKARYTEADDPKRLVDVDQMMHEAVAARRGRAHG